MVDTLDTVKNSTLETSRAKKMAFPPQRGVPPQMPPMQQMPPQVAAAEGSLKQAMKERSTRQAMTRGGPPGKPDERTESPQEKAREKRLGIP